jgi:hypothetical protein
MADAAAMAGALVAQRARRRVAAQRLAANRFAEYRALKELSALHPLLVGLFAELLRNRLRRNHRVDKPLAELSAEEAELVGANFGLELALSPSPEAAVRSWIAQNRPIQELVALFPWLPRMVEEMARQLVSRFHLGLAMRVGISLVLSYLDLVLDVLVTKQFYDSGLHSFALASALLLSFNMFLQICLSVTQNSRNPKVALTEVVYTVLCIKPALLARRIAQNEQRRAHQLFPPIAEHNYSKNAEVFGKGVPTITLHMLLLLRSGSPTHLQYASVGVAIAAAAFVVSSTDFALDTDPKNRAFEPEFYGFVPDKGNHRVRMLSLMFLCSCMQLSAVALATAILVDDDPNIAVYAWCGRAVVMYSWKLLRREFSYYLPIGGIGGVLVTVVTRAAMMLVSDIGLFAYARHPYEMGCWPWWFGRIWPWLLLLASLLMRRSTHAHATEQPEANSTLFTPLRSGGSGDPEADLIVLAAIAAALFGAWLLSLAGFFRLCAPESLVTFMTNESASAYTKRVRWDARGLQAKIMGLFRSHPSLLRVLCPDAQLLLASHWDEWMSAPPDWLPERWWELLPSSVLPAQVLTALGGKRRQRRASSLTGLVSVP